MSEVKETSNNKVAGNGLFATKLYEVGDVILEELPMVVLSIDDNDNCCTGSSLAALLNTTCHNKRQQEEERDIKLNIEDIVTDIPTTVSNENYSKFRSMIQAALCFVIQVQQKSITENTRKQLLNLYHPNIKDPIDTEKDIIELSNLAIQYLKQHSSNTKLLQEALLEKDDNDDMLILQKIMLIWACNAFDGGRIYLQISRVNHNCNPNAVIVVLADNNNKQKLVAGTKIEAGQEITISYLSIMLYTDTLTRKIILQKEKFFTCQCERCCCSIDKAGAIPCFKCHPRNNRQLEEEVQYDDEHTVKYAYPNNNNNNNKIICSSCNFQYDFDNESDNNEYSRLFKTNQTVIQKVVSFLQESQQVKLVNNDNDNDDSTQQIVLQEQLEQHIHMASSVLGAKHWTTNLLLLQQIDYTLKEYHANLLTNNNNNNTDTDDNNEDNMVTIAETIDNLDRVYRYIEKLNLNLHIGHLLSGVIIGIARALVSFGDIKSQKYASEWINKISTYNIAKFESIHGIEKVIHTLQTAWKRTEEEEQAEKRPEKRTKR